MVAESFADHNLRRAAIVRIGEKRILHAAIRTSQKASAKAAASSNVSKRTAEDVDTNRKRAKK